MPEALVTVALPYAREGMDYLIRATDSLMGQDFKGWHGFVMDDSIEGNEEIASIMSRYGDERITYRRNNGPHGIGNAWNACIDATDTELFCILHTDDELEPDYLSTMVRLSGSQMGANLYFCGATVIDKDGKLCFSLPDRVKELIEPGDEPVIIHGPEGIRRLIVGNYIMCPTIMYRRSAIGSRRFSPDYRFVLDFRFTLGVLFDGGTIVGTHRRAYRYRRHEAQATAQLSRAGGRFQEELDLFREVEDIASKLGWDRLARAARSRPIYRTNAALSRKWQYVWS